MRLPAHSSFHFRSASALYMVVWAQWIMGILDVMNGYYR
jgi:hypothetical protein